MTETANSVISDVLFALQVASPEQPLDPTQMQQAIRMLNRMMAGWDANGLSLGYTVVTVPTDVITVSDGAINGIIYNLAMRVAIPFDIEIPLTLPAEAREGLKEIRAIAVKVQPSSQPCTLPIGSGNQEDGVTWNNRFYPCPEDSVLTEGDGHITLEPDT